MQLRSLLSGIALFTFSLNLFSQDVNHTVKDILKIMEESKLSYELEETEMEIFQPFEKPTLAPTLYKIENEEGNITVEEIDYTGDTLAIFELAEKAYNEGKLDETRENYQKLLDLNPKDFLILTYMGQTYESSKNYDEAIKYYQKAIDVNFYNYMAHWFLADAYSTKGKKMESLKEISLAWVLNRNNSKVKSSLVRIMGENGKKFADWEFQPGCILTKEGKNVNIRFMKDWGPYALISAVWKFEPGFLEKLGFNEKSSVYPREREAILNLIAYLRTEKSKALKKNPSLKALNWAIDENNLNAFVLFEAAFPRRPILVFGQKPKTLEALADFVVKMHTQD